MAHSLRENTVVDSETIGSTDAADEPPRTTHMDVGSVPKRRERVGTGFTASLRVDNGIRGTTD